ncbi:hypothetical protein BJY01DRAFT_217385 [Aspergillus pseudoustus]|uniref:Uncharacterized protein n=1 Tax=Aspergillus pseudoustus TaxID=1810923 RepID=A0ABR4JNH5_9EURO
MAGDGATNSSIGSRLWALFLLFCILLRDFLDLCNSPPLPYFPLILGAFFLASRTRVFV